MYDVSFYTPSEIADIQGLETVWRRLLDENRNLYSFYQSPEWWRACLEAGEGKDFFLGMIRSLNGDLVGLLPLVVTDYPMRVTYGRGRVLATIRLRVAKMLGSDVLLGRGCDIHPSIFDSVLSKFPQCEGIYFEQVSEGARLWEYLAGTEKYESGHFLYVPRNIDNIRLVKLPDRLEEYTDKFGKKTKYNHDREVKRLREHGSGVLELIRIDQENQVSLFLENAERISRQTWQFQELGLTISNCLDQRSRFSSIARDGCLRCYLLRCGEEYCAFVRGWQFDGVFHYVQIGYDERFSKYSPGTVCLYLLIQDLFDYKKPDILNFFHGDNWYKRHFSTQLEQEASLFLFRKVTSVKMKVYFHYLFFVMKDFARKVLIIKKENLSDFPLFVLPKQD
ncbi:MAG: GNAT family N-acetyltransferase [Syntrophales bacterium]